MFNCFDVGVTWHKGKKLFRGICACFFYPETVISEAGSHPCRLKLGEMVTWGFCHGYVIT